MTKLNEWVYEYTLRHPEWVKNRRLEYLTNKYYSIGEKVIQLYNIQCPKWFESLIMSYINILKKRMNKIHFEVKAYIKPEFQDNSIDQQMIDEAREYPIGELVEVNKGFAKCVWHEDKNPSMYCKNNYAHCFSCGHTGDVIDIYMTLYNCNFKEAVQRLNI